MEPATETGKATGIAIGNEIANANGQATPRQICQICWTLDWQTCERRIDMFFNTLLNENEYVVHQKRFYGHRFSGKLQFSGQYSYDGRILFTNSGNFNIADSLGVNFAQFLMQKLRQLMFPEGVGLVKGHVKAELNVEYRDRCAFLS